MLLLTIFGEGKLGSGVTKNLTKIATYTGLSGHNMTYLWNEGTDERRHSGTRVASAVKDSLQIMKTTACHDLPRQQADWVNDDRVISVKQVGSCQHLARY